jgi:hypothetical protein
MTWPHVFLDENQRLCTSSRRSPYTEAYNSTLDKWGELYRSNGCIGRGNVVDENYRVYQYSDIKAEAYVTDSVSFDVTRDGFWVISCKSIWFYDCKTGYKNTSFPELVIWHCWSQLAIVNGRVYVVGATAPFHNVNTVQTLTSNNTWMVTTMPSRLINESNNHLYIDGLDICHLESLAAVVGDDILFVGGTFKCLNATDPFALYVEETMKDKAITSWNPTTNQRKLITTLPNRRTMFSLFVI